MAYKKNRAILCTMYFLTPKTSTLPVLVTDRILTHMLILLSLFYLIPVPVGYEAICFSVIEINYFCSPCTRQLLEPGELESELCRICAAIASKPREVIALGKRFYRKQLELSLDAAYRAGAEVMVDNLSYQDAQEGIRAFKEKRKPVFTHTDRRLE